ncbi:hypothetical protein KEM60_02846 [Austwickia sp. TVS 96-490-7B]|uniref:hypothetical protein n=1 Tax=Austwickia sp. TVS 96-490-7B TaxID=2830843 RepID=UPI001C58B01B|nr:hypothetical protein [Austwickia sp. TVS 96-490-7B]MBW3086617.1 hypothetical protein [Austwickia sp. TVS 96-490-7B]
MNQNRALLTLDRLRLAVARNDMAKKRSGVDDEAVDHAYSAAIRRDVLGLR